MRWSISSIMRPPSKNAEDTAGVDRRQGEGCARRCGAVLVQDAAVSDTGGSVGAGPIMFSDEDRRCD